MVTYEEVPDGHWVLVNIHTEEVLLHSDSLDNILEEGQKYEDIDIYIRCKNKMSVF